ncbi:DNA polymerase IV [Candidatus Kaiserbacteria bacterium]|nr:DNA polymerase IV [Candidatus Kaiserbacteria bacterium]
MAWNAPRSFPRAILHIDGDSFFASCEVAKNPQLRGKPVITGQERGIVSSMTYEARALGVRRAMSLHEIKRKFPEVIILPSDYETYSIFSHRMYEIVRRYTPVVEEYSIDECFADLTGLRRTLRMPYPRIVASIKRDLEQELGMTFSIGLSATKVLAKLGSKWQKPAGLTLIPLSDTRKYLETTPIGKIWGIGPNTSAYLQKFGIQTAYDFTIRSEAWVSEKLSKPGYELWKELNGESVLAVDGESRETYQSISKTKTFTPPSRSRTAIFSQLSKNIENACLKARRWNLSSSHIFFFLKTQEFKYHGCEIKLPHPTNVPQDMLRAVKDHYLSVFRSGVEYRATGITLMHLQDADTRQLDLFGAVRKSEGLQHVFTSVDALCERFGKHAIFLGSSFYAMTHAGHSGTRGEHAERTDALFRGENMRQRIGIPYLGEVA